MKTLLFLAAGFVSVFLLAPIGHSASPQGPCFKACRIVAHCNGLPCMACTQCLHSGTGLDTCTLGSPGVGVCSNCHSSCTVGGNPCNCP